MKIRKLKKIKNWSKMEETSTRSIRQGIEDEKQRQRIAELEEQLLKVDISFGLPFLVLTH